jgi:Raf kinase inhibitor-like YbhB/YbcL family protein
VGDEIQKQFTCDGDEKSLELAWTAPPAGTQSFTLIVVDQDSRLGYSFTHWVLYDLPAEKRELLEGLPKQEQPADGSRQGPNDFDKTGYGGRVVRESRLITTRSRHTRWIRNYTYRPARPESKLRKHLKSHVLVHGELIGRYQH